ncbi:phosphoribosylamine--glycine ligase [Candidatus Giovannonibacteria bacterium RIFCSPHIGHO2_02_FULL_44_31]|uniref:Phosphoribosylamine--glycine ligase n=1 Tax=Candidatus Giovannonibacteria bacterium RIFCSPLOWO2_12_FULL_44_15 TaxID=1798364 RepID=A0A1F5XYL8_9BACT|nr:MAG: phosphoribosylamine--glycine ligase [Candidatus Giovannonibacteria bacterium RIFCSPHIGHO2_02_FULL_44_31]OGF76041.1 MAG: phosphoribosylamine--glycine ligase [Candidatus Giovannonibacteria bacterium RIFCSPHIGHO2_12_FULL_44_29]OGF93057.1 MAG: phosphoribosylamine--glycine ligase [Candidatus Giovannonibacteria bacterium RIFCSPLOWO2_12_FULL_44_15]
MKILIVGYKGSEHALAWKLHQSAKVSKIYFAPGNAGTATLGENLPLRRIIDIVDWLKVNSVDLVLTCSASCLAEGLANEVEKLKIPFFGPTKAAAQIEWSKSFAKKFMRDKGIPTAAFEIFSDIDQAKQYVKNQNFPLVIKADGLAYGLGTIIAKNLREAELALGNLMEKKIFGKAGNAVVIEEFLEGREISIHAFCDGDDAELFPVSRDYKRLLDGDKGPNTGGMGSIVPVPWVTAEMMGEIKEKIVMPVLYGLKKMGRPFMGILFPGVMITSRGPVVLELNVRFGNPETQSYMRILKTDLVDVLLACVNKNLKNFSIEWSDNFACCVMAAAEGYPRKYKKGIKISGLGAFDANSEVVIFQAGTKINGMDTVVDKMGRALGVSAIGNDLSSAIRNAYEALDRIKFDGMQFRTDIGKKALIPFR